MRAPIIDTARTISIVSDTLDTEDREFWSIVTRCPVNGTWVSPEYYATRAEAQAALDAMFA
jgi:hypothetical protein